MRLQILKPFSSPVGGGLEGSLSGEPLFSIVALLPGWNLLLLPIQHTDSKWPCLPQLLKTCSPVSDAGSACWAWFSVLLPGVPAALEGRPV